jgi:SUKH-4 immunity protein
MTMRYPTLELVIFPDDTKIRTPLHRLPEVRDALFVTGIPKEFAYHDYKADDVLTFVVHGGRGRLIRFGSSELTDAVCVDPSTGEVVVVIHFPAAPPGFVNSSMPQFTRTMSEVIERFPYYSADASDEEIASASQSLQTIIRNIDPPALIPGRYWSTFIADVEIGDLSTEDVLAEGAE